MAPLVEQWPGMGDELGSRVSYLHPFSEGGKKEAYHSLALMRIPWQIPEAEGVEFLQKIVHQGILPIVFSGDSYAQGSNDQPWYYWPTDEFRQIGRHIVLSTAFSSFFHVPLAIESGNLFGKNNKQVLKYLALQTLSHEAFFSGGDFQTVESTKTLFYAENSIPLFLSYERSGNPFDFRPIVNELIKVGWSFESLDTTGISLPTHKGREDLDFVFFPFYGKDDRMHCIAANAFAERLPANVVAHFISNEEALRGGCNVADLVQGKVFISPNRQDASTYEILHRFARAKIIEAPKHYLEGGGGPRCLSSSITFGY